MASFTLEESEVPEFEVIPEGTIHPATIVSVEERETPWLIDDNDPSLGKKHQVSFRFQISEGEHKGRTLFGNTPTTFTNHPDCKLRAWVQEILGQNGLPVGFNLDLEELVDLPVKVAVAHRTKRNADGTETIREYASDVIRASGFEDAADAF